MNRNERVLTYLYIARSYARRYARACRAQCEDVEASAYLGLVQAADHFDPVANPGVPFSAYCRLWVRGGCANHCRRCRSMRAEPLPEYLIDTRHPESAPVEVREAVAIALETLEPRELEAIRARFFDAEPPRGCVSTQWRLLQSGIRKMRRAIGA